MAAHFVQNLIGSACPQYAEIGSTDLGIFFDMGDGEYGCLLGDTFSGRYPGAPGWWRSPLMLRSRTVDLGRGITFSGVVGGASARELVINRHDTSGLPGREWTVIPNDAFKVGDTLYLSAMSVNNWRNNTWQTNWAGLWCSTDDGETWSWTGRAWPNNARHTDIWQQQSWVVDGKYAYCFATSNGRHLRDGIYLQRVPVDRITDRFAYEAWGFRRTVPWWPFAGSWGWGNPATPILSGIFGEPSARKLGDTWVLSVLEISAGGCIVTRTTSAPDRPWTPPKVQLTPWQVPNLYGGFIHPASTVDDLHMTVSQWTVNSYHVMQYRGSAS